MSVELTSFEQLTLPPNHPMKELYYQEKQERIGVFETVYCRATKLGAVCLRCCESDTDSVQTLESPLSVVA